jgi:hypothetical protein
MPTYQNRRKVYEYCFKLRRQVYHGRGGKISSSNQGIGASQKDLVSGDDDDE